MSTWRQLGRNSTTHKQPQNSTQPTNNSLTNMNIEIVPEDRLPTMLPGRAWRQSAEHVYNVQQRAFEALQDNKLPTLSNLWESMISLPQRHHPAGRPLKQYIPVKPQARATAISALLARIGLQWAPTTQANRSYRWQSFTRFLAAQHPAMTPETATVLDVLTFLTTLPSPQTQREYLFTLKKLATLLQHPWTSDTEGMTLLRELQRNLSADSTNPVDPISIPHLHVWLTWTREQNYSMFLASLLAVMTASRIDEISRISRPMLFTFPQVTIETLGQRAVTLIAFLDATKGTGPRPYRIDSAITIPHPPFTQFRLPPGQSPFQSISNRVIYRSLQQMFPDQHYGEHSFKKRAFASLTEGLHLATYSPTSVNIVMKHLSQDAPFKDKTMSYSHMAKTRLDVLLGLQVPQAVDHIINTCQLNSFLESSVVSIHRDSPVTPDGILIRTSSQ